MADQVSDPVQDAGLASPPIQGVDEGVVTSGGDESAHVPLTTAPEEVQQSQETQASETTEQPYPGTATDASGDKSSDLA